MVYGELDGSAFAIEYIKRKREITRLSAGQKIPGMNAADVRQELCLSLLRAVSTYNPDVGTTLGQWWWAIWTNRKSDLIGAYFAKKNPHPELFDPEVLADICQEAAEAFEPMIDLEELCPSTDPKERAMWRMLCQGIDGNVIRYRLNLSVRRFYAIVSVWQTDDLRRFLVEGPA